MGTGKTATPYRAAYSRMLFLLNGISIILGIILQLSCKMELSCHFIALPSSLLPSSPIQHEPRRYYPIPFRSINKGILTDDQRVVTYALEKSTVLMFSQALPEGTGRTIIRSLFKAKLNSLSDSFIAAW